MKSKVTWLILFCLIFSSGGFLRAQEDSINFEGIKIIVPSKKKESKTWFFVGGGLQLPSWYRVPFIPENSKGLKVRGDSEIAAPGWFTGIGIMKKTRSNFEVGILVNYYKSSVPVAYAGENSTSNWVFEQSGDPEYLAINNIDRVSEVFSFRAAVRYKVPVGNFQLWGGIAPGTFSSHIYFAEENAFENPGSYREILLGISFQAGVDYIFTRPDGKEKGRITLFSDFSGPRVEEKMISLFEPGWIFINNQGNNIINPFRIGIALGIK